MDLCFAAYACSVVGFASLGGFAGSPLKFYGEMRDRDITHYWIRTGGELGSGVGGNLCDPYAPMQTGHQGEGGASYVAGGEDATAFVLCRVPVGNASAEAGRHLLSFEARPGGDGGRGYGGAFFSSFASQHPQHLNFAPPSAQGGISGSIAALPPKIADSKGIGFGVTIRPVIDSISLQRAGLGGGATVSIRGAGFSVTPGRNEVLLGDDVPCAITSETAREITCIAGPARNGAPFPAAIPTNRLFVGGVGLQHVVYMQSGYASGSAQRSAFDSWRSTVSSRFNAYGAATSAGYPASSAPARNYGSALPAISLPEAPATLSPTFADTNADSVTSRFMPTFYGGGATDQYVQVLEGFFVPPVTADYSVSSCTAWQQAPQPS